MFFLKIELFIKEYFSTEIQFPSLSTQSLGMPQKEILETIDVLCDGKFKIDLLSPEKHWVGSSNQRVISVQETLEKNEIVLYED